MPQISIQSTNGWHSLPTFTAPSLCIFGEFSIQLYNRSIPSTFNGTWHHYFFIVATLYCTSYHGLCWMLLVVICVVSSLCVISSFCTNSSFCTVFLHSFVQPYFFFSSTTFSYFTSLSSNLKFLAFSTCDFFSDPISCFFPFYLLFFSLFFYTFLL